MPPQLKTLLPLFAAFILLFIVARHFLVPESFGEKGHYRFNSIEENKEKALIYAGKESCTECHAENAALIQSDVHATLSCETCHGPGNAHCSDPKTMKMDLPRERENCGKCHDFNPSRGKIIQQVDIKVHHIEKIRCIECHNPHAPWQIKK
jgi:hypothetical protein